MTAQLLTTVVLGLSFLMTQSPTSVPQTQSPARQYFIAIFSRGPACLELHQFRPFYKGAIE